MLAINVDRSTSLHAGRAPGSLRGEGRGRSGVAEPFQAPFSPLGGMKGILCVRLRVQGQPARDSDVYLELGVRVEKLK